MADNLGVLEPTTPTSTVGADDISSVKYYRNKLIYGADGINKGDVEINNALPVGPAQAGAYEALVEKAFSFFTSSWQSLSLTNVATCRILVATNWTDGYFLLSFDAGSTTHLCLPPKTIRSITIPSGATQVHAKTHASLSAPTADFAWFEVVR